MDVAQIDWLYLHEDDERSVRVGEIVSADAGGMPIYRVMSRADGRAWLKNVADGSDCLMPLRAFHWRADLQVSPAQ